MELQRRLKEYVFHGWPDEPGPLAARGIASEEAGGLRLRVFEFSSQPHVALRLFVVNRTAEAIRAARLEVLDESGWNRWLAALRPRFGKALADYEAGGAAPGVGEISEPAEGEAIVWFAPRGLGPHAWPGDARKQIQFRRRFQLLGQTLEGMRVWDIQRAIGAAEQATGKPVSRVDARGSMAVNALYAAVFSDPRIRFQLAGLPDSFQQAPDYLNVLRVAGNVEVVGLLRAAGHPVQMK